MSNRGVLVVNPDEQGELFEARAEAAPRTTRAKKKSRKGKKARKGKARAQTGARAGQCRKTRKAPSTVECEPVKRNAKGQFKASGGRRTRRRRRKNPEPARSRRRRRRRNPEGESRSKKILGSIMDSIQRVVKEAVPRVGAKLAVSFAVRKWGDPWGQGIMGPGELISDYHGRAWTLKNYAIAIGVAALGARAIDRFIKPGMGRVFQDSIVDDLFGRLVYTEIIGRSETAKKYFGAVDMMPIGYDDDNQGNRFAVLEDTRYQPAMLGLERRGPLGAIVPVQALGDIAPRGPLGGGRRGRRRAHMGHLITDTPDDYQRLATRDPYLAAGYRAA